MTALDGLLAASASATARGDHAAVWRAVTRYGLAHWVDPLPEPGPDDRRGEALLLRATAADQLDLRDEAVTALLDLAGWADARGAAATAVLARAQLCLHAADGDAGATVALPDVRELLVDVLDRLGRRPSPCATSSLAAVTAYSCARTEAPDLAAAVLAEARRLAVPDAGDAALLRAQELHDAGDVDGAVALATTVADRASDPTREYEARELLGVFAMLAGDDARTVRHWGRCACIALDLGAPLVGLHRVELVCQLLNAHGEYARAFDLASRYAAATTDAPVSPGVLNLHAVLARAAVETGRYATAWRTARWVAEWSELTPDVLRTSACYSVAALAGTELGAVTEVARLLERQAESRERAGHRTEAAQSLRAAARGLVTAPSRHRPFGDAAAAEAAVELALSLMDRSRRLLTDAGPGAPDDETRRWHLADWNDDMAVVWHAAGDTALALGCAEDAATGFAAAGDHGGAATAWTAAADLHLASGDAAACDRALAEAAAHLDALGLTADDPARRAWREVRDRRSA
ncbi:hypothetical protein [Corynebacterium bovis]|uniref:hypothetical protein n=1 Tax=Corynebacterium bovis TaxID=36808 RepID=UPI003139838B